MPRKILVEWSVVRASGAGYQLLEGIQVVFGPRLEGDVLEIGGVKDDRLEYVPEHGGVDLAVGGLVVPIDPGDVEDVGDVGERRELSEGFIGIRDVALDVLDGVIGVPGGTFATGYAVDLPGTARGIGKRENLGQTVADDAGDADDQTHALVQSLRMTFIAIGPLLCNQFGI
ncbi:hypothetical protein NE237_017125 [Protea cynaroides]|uniref:Uncharacterized protein n=1 Tax=Protea cynaroides TaxID=273540 RepID=A0A9Q0K7F4_9MAGN|nr:hypothetical protein NE237_017125 [Protea cynaroides]